MRKKIIPTTIVLVLLVLAMTGCFDNNPSTYVAHATKISYWLTYGYEINCSGEGELSILYDCDTPELLDEPQPQIVDILNNDYEFKTIVTNNEIIRWNFSTDSCTDYRLGLTASVVAESFVVSDLNGGDAWTINQLINENMMVAVANPPNMVRQYCHPQSNETTTFIDPTDPKIVSLAQSLYEKADSENAFIVAKEIFKWLKENTTYTTHTGGNNVQTAPYTLEECTGDCDDLTYLYISLCRAVSIPARFIRGFLVEEDRAIPHAWAEVYVGGNVGNEGWIPVECAGTATGSSKIQTEIHQNFGLENAQHLRLFVDDGTNESLIESQIGISLSASESLDMESPSVIIKVQNYRELESHELHVDENNIRVYQ